MEPNETDLRLEYFEDCGFFITDHSVAQFAIHKKTGMKVEKRSNWIEFHPCGADLLSVRNKYKQLLGRYPDLELGDEFPVDLMEVLTECWNDEILPDDIRFL